MANNIFDLNINPEDASIILIPVPWETTVSYRKGTSDGPKYILQASPQIDMFDIDFPESDNKFYMLPINENIKQKSLQLQQIDDKSIINEECQEMVNWVYEETKKYIINKKVGLIGGEHSVILGYIKSLAELHNFGILQIDSHADLRNCYNNLIYSHASIMHNVLKIKEVTKLVQVGIRDYSKYEYETIQNSEGRIITFFDNDIKDMLYNNVSWHSICEEIINSLPYKVYISFDIDGLDPKLCPDTGTPVPGGFDMYQIFYLFKLLQKSGKKIIGFDLNGVSNGNSTDDTINSITGARVLYKLCNLLNN